VTKGMKFPDDHLIELDFNAMVTRGLFPVRIGVMPETAPYDWLTLRRMSRMKPSIADGLIGVAPQEVGADPSDWYGTFNPVTTDQWVDLQVY
jgi:hypothetical protein